MSERYDCTDPDGRAEGIPAAASAVRRGEIVVLPTDTVYGIGCDAFDATAVASVLAAKGRGRDMPPPVLIPTARTAQGLATQVPDYAQRLMEKFWPGPLTLVLKAQTSLHWDLGETNGTVALRVPDHEITLELLGDIGPMAVTSANTTGDPAARTVDEAVGMLGESVGVYLDGGPAGEGAALDDRRLHRRDAGDPAASARSPRTTSTRLVPRGPSPRRADDPTPAGPTPVAESPTPRPSRADDVSSPRADGPRPTGSAARRNRVGSRSRPTPDPPGELPWLTTRSTAPTSAPCSPSTPTSRGCSCPSSTASAADCSSSRARTSARPPC